MSKRGASSISWQLLALLLLPLILAGVAFFLPMQEWVEWLAGKAAEMGIFGTLLFVAANALAAVFLVPGWIFTVTAGVLYGLGKGTIIAHSGTMAGALASFLCGRYLVRRRVTRLVEHNQKFRAVDEAIGRQGWKIVSLIRLSPVIPFCVQNYLYSVSSIRLWPYLITSALCTLPGTILYVYLGAIGRYGVTGERPDGGPLQWILLGIGLLATIFGTIYIRKVAQRALAEVAPL